MELANVDEALLAWAAVCVPEGVRCTKYGDLNDGQVVQTLVYKFHLDPDVDEEIHNPQTFLSQVAFVLAAQLQGSELDVHGIAEGEATALQGLLAHILLLACNSSLRDEAMETIMLLSDEHQETLAAMLHQLMEHVEVLQPNGGASDGGGCMRLSSRNHHEPAEPDIDFTDPDVAEELRQEMEAVTHEVQIHEHTFHGLESEVQHEQADLDDAMRFLRSETELARELLNQTSNPLKEAQRAEDHLRALKSELEHVKDVSAQDEHKLEHIQDTFSSAQRKVRQMMGREVDLEMDLHKDELRSELAENHGWKVVAAKAKLGRYHTLSQEEHKEILAMDEVIEAEVQYIESVQPEVDVFTTEHREFSREAESNHKEIEELESYLRGLEEDAEKNQSMLAELTNGSLDRLHADVVRQQNETRAAVQYLQSSVEQLPDVVLECRELEGILDPDGAGGLKMDIAAKRARDTSIREELSREDVVHKKVAKQLHSVHQRLAKFMNGDDSECAQYETELNLKDELQQEVLLCSDEQVDMRGEILQHGGSEKADEEEVSQLETAVDLYGKLQDAEEAGTALVAAYEVEEAVQRLQTEEVTLSYETEQYKALLKSTRKIAERLQGEAAVIARTKEHVEAAAKKESSTSSELQGVISEEVSAEDCLRAIAGEEETALMDSETRSALEAEARSAALDAQQGFSELESQTDQSAKGYIDELRMRVDAMDMHYAELRSAQTHEVEEHAALNLVYDRLFSHTRLLWQRRARVRAVEEEAQKHALVHKELVNELRVQEQFQSVLSRREDMIRDAEIEARAREAEWSSALKNGKSYEKDEATAVKVFMQEIIAESGNATNVAILEAAVERAQGFGVRRADLADAEKTIRVWQAALTKAEIQAEFREEAAKELRVEAARLAQEQAEELKTQRAAEVQQEAARMAKEEAETLRVRRQSSMKRHETMKEELALMKKERELERKREKEREKEREIERARVSAEREKERAERERERAEREKEKQMDKEKTSERPKDKDASKETAKGKQPDSKADQRKDRRNEAEIRESEEVKTEELEQYSAYIKALKTQSKLRDKETVFLEKAAAEDQLAHDREKVLLASSLHRFGLRYGRLLSSQERIEKSRQ